MAEKLSWTELRRLIATRAGVSEKTAAAFLNSFNKGLIEALKEDKQVKINGLGTFKLQAVAARKSVNVKTGEEITIPGYNKIVFTSEAGVKELVESNGERRKANGEKRMANGARRMANGEGMENDPLVKLGVQAAEIVDILGELGQSPNEEPKVEEPKVEEPKVEEKPEIPEVPETPEVIVEPEKQEEKPVEEPVKPVEKPKKKFHFWRDTLICVVVLMILLVVGFFFFRHQLSSWIRSKVCKQTEQTEQVIQQEPKAPQEEPATANFEQEAQEVPEKPEILENPEILESPEEPVEETVIEEVVVEEQHYEKWIKTEAITEGSRLAWIAKKYYGSVIYWPYLYDANKDHIDNPNKIKVGTPIRVPKLTKAQKDTTTAQFLKLKQAAEAAIR